MSDDRPYEDTPTRDIHSAWQEHRKCPLAAEGWWRPIDKAWHDVLEELDHVRAECDLSRQRFQELAATNAALEVHANRIALELQGCRAQVERLLEQRGLDFAPRDGPGLSSVGFD